jgi:hypothetical protein
MLALCGMTFLLTGESDKITSLLSCPKDGKMKIRRRIAVTVLKKKLLEGEAAILLPFIALEQSCFKNTGLVLIIPQHDCFIIP